MGEISGVLAAVLSSGLGGTSIGATRYLVGSLDPLAIGSFRFGIGFLLLLPLTLLRGDRWPGRGDWAAATGLGILFFALFPILFNASLIFTTAARGALALSTLPLLSLVIGAALGAEALSWRKSIGVVIATFGVAVALLSDLTSAPSGAWRGDLLMMAAALCMALYGIWSKPLIRRSSPIAFTTLSMAAGAACLILLSCFRGSFAPVANFGTPQWLAALYLGAFGAALNVSFDVIVQSPSSGWSTKFFALFVVVTRSPASGLIVSAPPPTVRFAGSGRTTVHFGSSVAPVNSSLLAACAKFTV